MADFRLNLEMKKQKLAFIREEKEKKRIEKLKDEEAATKLFQELLKVHISTFGPFKLMDVPPLLYSSWLKILTSLINKELLDMYSPYSENQFCIWDSQSKCKSIGRKVSEIIRKLNIWHASFEKLDKCIESLCYEISEWLETSYCKFSVKDDTFFIIINNIQNCWLIDGTIDQEESVQLIIKNNDILPINRFHFACHYCFYEDVLNLWELLSETEKTRLQTDPDSVVKKWIVWLESKLNKDWQFCVAWILGTSFWNKNVCVLKRVLGALTPKERRYYLKETLTQKKVSRSVVRFCQLLMIRDEQ